MVDGKGVLVVIVDLEHSCHKVTWTGMFRNVALMILFLTPRLNALASDSSPPVKPYVKYSIYRFN